MTRPSIGVAEAPGQHGFRSTYLPRYLDANGAIKVDPGIDRKLVEVTTAAAAMATRATVHITQPLATA
jgi:hypothetical protein